MITKGDLTDVKMRLDSDFAKNRLEYLRWFFFADYQRWYAYNDDRKIFCNMFENLLESIEVIDKVEHNSIIALGYSMKCKECYNDMEEIQKRFKEIEKGE